MSTTPWLIALPRLHGRFHRIRNTLQCRFPPGADRILALSLRSIRFPKSNRSHGGPEMTAYRDRLIRAIKLDPELYEEVEADHGANGQALLTVVLSSLAAGVGGALSGGWYGILLNTLVALAGWVVWAFLSY